MLQAQLEISGVLHVLDLLPVIWPTRFEGLDSDPEMWRATGRALREAANVTHDLGLLEAGELLEFMIEFVKIRAMMEEIP